MEHVNVTPIIMDLTVTVSNNLSLFDDEIYSELSFLYQSIAINIQHAKAKGIVYQMDHVNVTVVIMDPIVQVGYTNLGVIQKPRGHNFALF